MGVKLILLGTGAGPGVPAYYCDCVACQEARKNSRLARTRSGAVILTGKENILIDASPDLRFQLIKEGIKSLDSVFISHWHYDHFGGLGDLEFYVKLKRKKPLKLFLPPESVENFFGTYAFLEDVFEINSWCFGEKYFYEDVTLTPLPAIHGIQTAGFYLEGRSRIAYFTDTAGLSLEVMNQLRGLDMLICDATFYGENWYPNSHMSTLEAIRLGKEIKAKKIVLTHLAMHYSTPITVVSLKKELDEYPNVFLAEDGMTIKLDN